MEFNQILGGMYPSIPAGLEFIEKTTGQKMETEHTFWFYSNNLEMITIMRRGLKIDDTRLILSSVKRRSYFDDSNSVLLALSPPQSDKIFRVIYTKIASSLIEKNNYPANHRSDWFLYGFSSYLAFRAENEMQGKEAGNTDQIMMKYYSPLILSKDIQDQKVSGIEAWKEAIDKYPEQTFAHASLLSLHLVKTYGLEKAAAISRSMVSMPFPEAFKKETGDDLEKFYASLPKNFYPEIDKLKSSDA